MNKNEHELRERLRDVNNPVLEGDIVELGIVDGIRIDGGTATVTLALNTPGAPAERILGERIRDALIEAGFDPELHSSPGPEHGFEDDVLPNVRNVILIASGKGGVGKTTIAANLAAGLAAKNANVGILDADIHGPNLPRLLPVDGEPETTPDNEIIPPRSGDVKVMSMAFLTRSADDPAILRSPITSDLLMQFIDDVAWGWLDYLIIDLPPGTGDATLDVLQSLPVTGVGFVTTPQRMAVDDTRKSLGVFERHETPILGIVENMSGYRCENCDHDSEFFGSTGSDEIVADFDTNLLGRVPVHPSVGDTTGVRPLIRNEDSAVRKTMAEVVEAIADRISAINMRTVTANVDRIDHGEGEDMSSGEDGQYTGTTPREHFHSSS